MNGKFNDESLEPGLQIMILQVRALLIFQASLTCESGVQLLANQNQ